MVDTFLIVDGNSLTHRAFHALPLLSYNDIYTNAVQGFFSMLLKVIQEQKPQYVAVCFDEHGPTFRHSQYEDYKAGRKPTPEELRPQFPIIKDILSAMGLGVLSLCGYEADDLLGTLSQNANNQGVDALLLTGDRDALQLASEQTRILFTKKGISETQLFTPEEIRNTYDFSPEQVTDWKGLAGDASDNIPGVPGVGDKTAVKLLKTYGTLEQVLAHAEDIPGKLGEKIRANKAQALLSKDLAVIRRDVPIPYNMHDFTLNHLKDALPLFTQYGLITLQKRLNAMGAQETPLPPVPAAAQTPFGEGKTLHSLDDIAALCEELLPLPCAICAGETLTIAAQNGQHYSVATTHDLLTPGLAPQDVYLALKPLLENGQIIVHDAKAFMHQLAALGIRFAAPYFDTMIAQYLINPQEKSYGLVNFAEVNAVSLYHLYERQQQRLAQEQMAALYEDIELKLVPVLYGMEKEGFCVDEAVLKSLGDNFTQRIEALRQDVFTLTGVPPFNLNSTQQLGKVLFETLGLPHGKKGKTGYSTNAEVLEGLVEQHPAIAPILEYRQLTKLNSTYIDGLLRLKDHTGRVHSTFDQTATATGRISSNEPNLQNIPVRTAVGRDIRRAFVPRAGWMLIDADYSQIELRILAHFSKDPAMVEAFQKGQDIHTRTAAEVYDVDMAQVTPQMRSSAKAVNFGLVYGISEFGLARNIGVSRQEAAAFIQTYFKRYPGVKRFMDEAVADGQSHGFAQTAMGRRRYLKELLSDKATIRDFGKRIAMNMPVQGTAADIIKLAMVKVSNRLDAENLQARLILQVHDELLIECPPNEVSQTQALLKETMENVVTLSVPLVADVHVGHSWFETK